MMKHIIPFWCAILFLATAFIGCKPGVPSEIIQPGDMEDILYDYHVADGIPYVDGDYSDLAYRRHVYREAALRKHGITQAQLDSSLVYYYRHTELLHDIYQRLSKRLNNDAIALGATANELSQFEGLSSQGDTTTVWSNSQSLVLMPIAPYNSFTFEVKTDSAYHEGDKMILSFDNQYVFQEGVRDGTAMMAITFHNDSTAHQMMRITGDNHYTLQVSDMDRLGIKSIRGFIYLGKGMNNDNNSQTLKIMCVSNMKLVRMHTTEPNENGESGDSVPERLQPLDMGAHGPSQDIPKRPSVDINTDNLPKEAEEIPNTDKPKRVFDMPDNKRKP